MLKHLSFSRVCVFVSKKKKHRINLHILLKGTKFACEAIEGIYFYNTGRELLRSFKIIAYIVTSSF